MNHNVLRVLVALPLVACALGVSPYIPGSGADHKCVDDGLCGITSQACISANHPSGGNPQNICIYCDGSKKADFCGAQDGTCTALGSQNCGKQWISSCAQVPWNAPYGTCTGGFPAGTGNQTCVVFDC